MLINLRKNLTVLFVFSVMLIFTIVFCILINENIKSKKVIETNFFNRISTNFLFTLENSSDYIKDLQNAEQSYNLFLLFMDSNHNTMYQSSAIFQDDIDNILNNFYIEMCKVKTYSIEKVFRSSISGCFYFKSSAGHSYIGTTCEVATSNGDYYTLYIIKDFPSSFDLIKQLFSVYFCTWILVFISILILSNFIIGAAVKPTEISIRSQKEFIASVSHELKSPLAVILSSAETIDSYPALPEHMRVQTSIIDSECIRMSKLIHNLLLLSSIDTKTWTLHKTDINVDSMMINLYEKFEPLCNKLNLTLTLIIEDRTFPTFKADIERISQILSIFVDNAKNYSFPNTDILLKVQFAKGSFIFSIIDHGQGIPDKDKPFIYDRFYCSDKSRTKKEHFGLGLSIAKELVSMHKGNISLTDTPNGGCTFQISFPSIT